MSTSSILLFWQDRSIVIATYALCGFANISSIGMVMGALGTLAPHRQSVISQMAVRAMICGTAVSFMNACVAGKDMMIAQNSSLDCVFNDFINIPTCNGNRPIVPYIYARCIDNNWFFYG